MALTQRAELTVKLIAALNDSEISVDEKIKALGAARAHLTHKPSEIDTWRRDRLETGPVGSSKKTEAIRSELAAQKSSRTRKK